jgi:hypothetical protein
VKRWGGGRTALYPSLLSLIHDELLQFLLVAVAQLAQVEVAEAAAHGVHGCCCRCEGAWVREFEERLYGNCCGIGVDRVVGAAVLR